MLTHKPILWLSLLCNSGYRHSLQGSLHRVLLYYFAHKEDSNIFGVYL